MNRWKILVGAVLILFVGVVGRGVFFGGSDVDDKFIEQLRMKYASHEALVKENLEPSIVVGKTSQRPYIEEDLVRDVKDFEPLSFGVAARSWEGLGAKVKGELLPYMLKPTDEASAFNVRHWKIESEKSAFLEFIFERALADDLDDEDSVEHFAAPSGYEYFNSLNYDIRVYYPGVDLVPSSGYVDSDASSHLGDDVAEQNYNFLKFRALQILVAANQAYPEFVLFFGQHLSEPVEMYVIQSIVSGASGLTLDCQRVYVPYNGGDFAIESVTAHELFHCFQEHLNIGEANIFEIFLENVGDGDRRRWMLEGGAVFGQYLANMPSQDTHYFFKNYAGNPSKSLFDREYNAALFWHQLYEQFGEGVTSSQMLAYQDGGDNQAQADMLHDKFHQIALNVSGIQELYSDGTALEPVDDTVIPLNTKYTEEDIEGVGQAYPFELDLGEMSMNFFDFLIVGQGGFVRFDFGQEINQENDDIEISAVLYDSSGHIYEKVSLEEDPDGRKYVMFCMTNNEVCDEAGRSTHEGLYRVMLIITNRSGENTYIGDFLGTLFGPDPYRAFQVVMNEGELEVPVRGDLELTIDLEDATMRMDARAFWMSFENDYYNWDSREVPQSPNVSDVKIHPTRLTSYVNNFCQFRGFVEFDFELLSENDDDAPWITRKFKLKKTDQGNFYVMKHKFACKIDPKMVELMAVNGPALMVLQTMFAKINTETYPEGSFAMNLHRIFKEFMSLGLWNDEEGEVEMKFLGEDTYEAVKIEFNDRLHLYFDREG